MICPLVLQPQQTKTSLYLTSSVDREVGQVPVHIFVPAFAKH